MSPLDRYMDAGYRAIRDLLVDLSRLVVIGCRITSRLTEGKQSSGWVGEGPFGATPAVNSGASNNAAIVGSCEVPLFLVPID